MRHHGEPAASAPPPSPQPGTASDKAARPPGGSDWKTLSRLLPYLWQYKWRVVIALSLMVGAKLANVSVPLLLKELVDAMSLKPGDAQVVLVVPVALLVAYGALRLLTSAFTELPVLFRHAEAAARLPPHHRDPFDRMLIAQARVEGLVVITRDSSFTRYDLKLIGA